VARATAADRARVAAETAADTVEAVDGAAPAVVSTVPAPFETYVPKDVGSEIVGDIYRLSGVTFTEKEGVFSWTASVLLGSGPVANAIWNGTKKSGNATAHKEAKPADLIAFQDTAKLLLPQRDSVSDLIQVLAIVMETNVSKQNQETLLRDVPGSPAIVQNRNLLKPGTAG
jgi:hypothetical protein